MQSIRGIAEEVRKAIDHIIPSVTNTEKYTAVGACVVALHHADLAISQERDHLRARQCLFALQPFRTLVKEVASGRDADADIVADGYFCAVALKRSKIDEAGYVDEMMARLGKQLPRNRREDIDKDVNERADELPGYRPANDHEGWVMVQLMLDGESCGGAFLDLHNYRVAAEKVKQFLQEKGDERNGLIGRALPNGGSLVVGPNSSTVHFGLGGGSVTVVDGKLAYIFPR
jgi:hypothetical protein